MSMRQSNLEGYEEEMEDDMEEQNDRYQAPSQSNHALQLEWSIGFNYKLVNGVINLKNDKRKKIFYVAGNTGVIYDYENPKQTLLQGHCTEITCCAFCKERDIIVTADRGPSSLMVVWDVSLGTPLYSIFDPHPNGVESLDITNDGKIIVTISREDKEAGRHAMQTVKVWEYTVDETGAASYQEVRSEKMVRLNDRAGLSDYQKYIHINKWKDHFEEFATTGEERVFFWKVDPANNYSLKYYQPPNSSIGKKDKRDKKVQKGKDGEVAGRAGKGLGEAGDKEAKDGEAKAKDEAGDVKAGEAGDKSSKEDGGKKLKKGKEDGGKQGELTRKFTQTVFIPPATGTQAVTGTDDGLLVVWDISLILEDMTEPDHRREIKTINLLNVGGRSETERVGISVLMSCPLMLVIGATNGYVRFYDYQFRIVGWFEDDEIGEVTSISLSNKKFDFQVVEQQLKNSSHEFKYPDFIVVDKNARIVRMKADLFNEIPSMEDKQYELEDAKRGERDSLNSRGPDKRTSQNKKLLLESIPGRINCISVSPREPVIAMSCENRHIYQWDYSKKEIKPTKLTGFKFTGVQLKLEHPTCLQYSPNGEHLIVATNMKNVFCYKVQDKQYQKNTLSISQKKTWVTALAIKFSENSEYFAIMDDQSSVSLYKLEKAEMGEEFEQGGPGDKHRGGRHGKKEAIRDWVFAGKLRSHMTDINDLCFIESFYDKEVLRPMLYSVGEDKYLIEYDVENSTKKVIPYSEPLRIEHEVAPKACISYPINSNRREPVLMVATADYKIKLWNVKSRAPEDKRCVASFLGPTYGGPINKMLYLKRREEDANKYVAYATAEKIAGIIKLPLDGNPNKTMGMIAHPGRISAMTATNDGKFLFTSGYDDIGIVNMWFVNYAAIEEQERVYAAENNPLDIYPNLLEGGKNGQIFRDLKDFFYYAQIKSSSANPTKAKKLDGKIPHFEVPFLMRALGYYPTRQEGLNMVNEVLYSKKDLTFKVEETLELDTFVKLFINHRPVYGLTASMVREKMKALGDGGKLSKSKFVEYMTSLGDKFEHADLKSCLNILLAPGELDDILPEEIDSDYMIEKILGMEVDDEETDEHEEYPSDANN